MVLRSNSNVAYNAHFNSGNTHRRAFSQTICFLQAGSKMKVVRVDTA